ncbi:hypothetical protein STRDD11_01336 [Streptococcus sp. DD11]|nr:hypothetical protein STRDD11_01336 [Streptococcus sp. DD11]
MEEDYETHGTFNENGTDYDEAAVGLLPPVHRAAQRFLSDIFWDDGRLKYTGPSTSGLSFLHDGL